MVLAVIAVLAWAGVGFFAYQIGALENARAADMRTSQQRSQQSVQASYLHGIVSSSATDRAQLDTLIAVDPASLADMIDSAGTKPASVSRSATHRRRIYRPWTARRSAQGFSFLATSQGEFASAMQAAALLESLPIPSSVQAIRLSHTQTSPGTPARVLYGK